MKTRARPFGKTVESLRIGRFLFVCLHQMISSVIRMAWSARDSSSFDDNNNNYCEVWSKRAKMFATVNISNNICIWLVAQCNFKRIKNKTKPMKKTHTFKANNQKPVMQIPLPILRSNAIKINLFTKTHQIQRGNQQQNNHNNNRQRQQK